MERLLEDISFDATDVAAKSPGTFTIDPDYVDEHLANLAGDSDLSRFIL